MDLDRQSPELGINLRIPGSEPPLEYGEIIEYQIKALLEVLNDPSLGVLDREVRNAEHLRDDFIVLPIRTNSFHDFFLKFRDHILTMRSYIL